MSTPHSTGPIRDGVNHLTAECEALSRTMKLCRALAESDRMIDVVSLEGGVGLLCAKALDLDPAEGRALRPALRRLHDDLDDLVAATRAAHAFHLRQKADPCSRLSKHFL